MHKQRYFVVADSTTKPSLTKYLDKHKIEYSCIQNTGFDGDSSAYFINTDTESIMVIKLKFHIKGCINFLKSKARNEKVHVHI